MNTRETVLFIDGENFLFSVAEVLKNTNRIKHKSQITRLSINSLVSSALKDFNVGKVKFYAGKIHIPNDVPELVEKSKIVAETQRRLKRYLTNENIEFILSGHVRLQDTKVNHRGKLHGVFKEKGTDVKIAVDMISLSCDSLIEVALLLSSDSDMQPAVKEMIKRGVTVVYIGFENHVNVGLSKTTSKTVILRQSEILDAWDIANPPQLQLSSNNK
jgi:uncharacterized LabA/DUF88 family protein